MVHRLHYWCKLQHISVRSKNRETQNKLKYCISSQNEQLFGWGTRPTFRVQKHSSQSESIELPVSFGTGNQQLPSISFTAETPMGFDQSPRIRSIRGKKIYV
jgi:hypothetical protein